MKVLLCFFQLFIVVCHTEILFKSGGATFPQQVYEHWDSAYGAELSELSLEYLPTGSGIAKDNIVQGELSMVASDSLLSESDYNTVPDLQVRTYMF